MSRHKLRVVDETHPWPDEAVMNLLLGAAMTEPREAPPEWRARFEAAIRSFGALSRAESELEPPQATAIESAVAYLHSLPEKPKRVAPLADGGVIVYPRTGPPREFLNEPPHDTE